MGPPLASSRIAERVAAAPVRPTPAELAPLRPFERLAFRWCDLVNTRPAAKRAAQLFLRHVGMAWVRVCSSRLVRIDGAEIVRALDLSRGVLLCSNHRSFFDMYALTCWIGALRGRLPDVYYPVRANFFYQGPLGLVVNMAMAAFAMYPPVFREPEKRDFNAYALARVVELLRRPGALIGFHPEGTRGKGPDPYTLLPAQPGVGRIIYEARPTVLPAFINGLGNDVLRQIRGNFDGTGTPVHIVFGQPLELAELYDQPNRLRTHKAIADRVLGEIARLGARERALRAEAEAERVARCSSSPRT